MFKIAWVDHALAYDGDEVWGLVNWEKQTISITSVASSQRQANTVLHEILHVIHDNMSYDLIHGDEEAVTNQTTNILMAVIAGNPGLFDWIRSQST